ncbi:MAG TPA: ABC transporter substrate-binding protein [Trueperaceae bacterium]|nr:ABC transporter substrate-binding protein [Trueperaceae bacterium]
MRKTIVLLFLALFIFPLGLAQSSRNSTLVIGVDLGDLITLDPGVCYEFSCSTIGDNIYETLVRFEGTNLSEIKPGLADSWEFVPSATGTNLVFHLRDAKFASGNPVTANDVAYSLDRVIGFAGPSSFLISDVLGIDIGDTEALDDKTVVIHLPSKTNPSIALNVLTFVTGAVVDSEIVKSHEVDNDWGTTWLGQNSAGSGPYTLARYDAGSQVFLQDNPNASRSGSLKRVILRDMKESSAQQAALKSGEIDVAYDFTPEAFIAAESNPEFKALRTDTFGMQYLGMNSGPGAPFEDNRVRQAVRMAINQDEIINDLLSSLGFKMQTIIPRGLLGADTNSYYEYNPEKAKALLKEAGAEGMEVEFLTSTGSCNGGIPCTDLAAKIQNDLANVGITANIRQMVAGEMYTIYRAQDAQLILAGWSPDYPDPDGNVTPLADYDAKSLAWRNVWDDETAKNLAKSGASESDVDTRLAIYNELTEYEALNGPFAILYQPIKAIVVRANVDGFVRNAQGSVDYTAISKK